MRGRRRRQVKLASTDCPRVLDIIKAKDNGNVKTTIIENQMAYFIRYVQSPYVQRAFEGSPGSGYNTLVRVLVCDVIHVRICRLECTNHVPFTDWTNPASIQQPRSSIISRLNPEDEKHSHALDMKLVPTWQHHYLTFSVHIAFQAHDTLKLTTPVFFGSLLTLEIGLRTRHVRREIW